MLGSIVPVVLIALPVMLAVGAVALVGGLVGLTLKCLWVIMKSMSGILKAVVVFAAIVGFALLKGALLLTVFLFVIVPLFVLGMVALLVGRRRATARARDHERRNPTLARDADGVWQSRRRDEEVWSRLRSGLRRMEDRVRNLETILDRDDPGSR